MIKYIVLDIDRTLVDSYQPELLSLEEAIEKVLGYKLNDEQTKNFTVMPTSIFLKYLNLTDEQIKKVMKEWENTFSKYFILPFQQYYTTYYKVIRTYRKIVIFRIVKYLQNISFRI